MSWIQIFCIGFFSGLFVGLLFIPIVKLIVWNWKMFYRWVISGKKQDTLQRDVAIKEMIKKL